MNIWELGAEIMIFSLFPLTWSAMRGSPGSRLVAFLMGSVVVSLIMMLLTMAFNRMPMMDLAMALALMSFGGGIVFARFFERHLR